MHYRGLGKQLAIALEAVGCSLIGVGLAIELTMGADIGYVVITGGACAISIGGMVFAKLLRRKEDKSE